MEIGRHAVEVVRNELTVLGDKPAVRLIVRLINTEEQEETEVVVWLTEKAAGIARAQLKVAGFSPDEHSLEDLATNETLLKGRGFDVVVEEFGGRLRASIPLRTVPAKKEIQRLDALLKDAKKSGEEGPKKKAPAKSDAPAKAEAPEKGDPLDLDSIPF